MNEQIKKEILSWLKILISSLIFAWILTQYIIVNAMVPTGSMENTIMTGDRLIAFRLSYTFQNPQRDDIVVFKYPDDENVNYIKRIIGLPGDKVEIKNGKVYINDSVRPLDDSFIKEKMLGSWGPYYVPDDSYFMLGDNRNDSNDSRFWENSFVKKKEILGKAIFKYYPKIEFFTSE